MTITPKDLRLYGSASMPDDNTPTNIGGAISLAKALQFADVSGTLQGVSSDAGDTTQDITVSYLDVAGALQTLMISLNGTTPVTDGTTVAQLLKAVKSASCAGDVAIEAQSAERSNTAQAGDTDTITLDAGASAVSGFYRDMIIRITAGTGTGQIRQIIAYDGASKIAQVSRDWGTPPDNTSDFRISKGFYFELSPDEITEVRRPFFQASASGSTTEEYYEKAFLKNTHATDTLFTAMVREITDASGLITFGLAATKDDTGGNGGGNNRQVAPGGITFDSADKSVPTNQLDAGEAIGVWLKLELGVGEAADNVTWVPRLQGTTT